MARTMTVDTGDDLRQFVELMVETGDYKTNSEVIRDGLRLLQEKQANSKLQQLKQLLQEGEASGTPLSWDMNEFLGRMKSKSNDQ